MKAKNLSKVLAFLVAAVMIFSALPLMAFAADEATTYTVSFGAPAIPMNVDTKVDLKALNVEMVKGEAAVSGAEITWAADAQEGLILDAVNKTVKVTAVGNYKLTATVDGGTPKNIWVIAKPANEETIYLVNIPNVRDTIRDGNWQVVANKNNSDYKNIGDLINGMNGQIIPHREDGIDFVQIQSSLSGLGGALIYVDEIFKDFADYTVKTKCAVAGLPTSSNSSIGAGVAGRVVLDEAGTKYTKGILTYIRQSEELAAHLNGGGDFSPICPTTDKVDFGDGWRLWSGGSNEWYTVKNKFDGNEISFYINDDGVDKIDNVPGDKELFKTTDSDARYSRILESFRNDGAGYPGVVGFGQPARFAEFYVYLNSTAMPATMTDEPEAPTAKITIVGNGTANVDAVVGSENTYTVTLDPAEGYKLKVGSLVINGDIAHGYDDTGCVYTFTTNDLDNTTIAVEFIEDNGQFNTAMLGAKIPTNPEVKGIRFGARTDSIKRSAVDATKGLLNDTINVDGKDYTITEIGMILFPTQLLGDADLTVDTVGVVRQAVTKIVGLTNGYADIAITLTEIPDTMVEVQITSRMYVAYTDANDTIQYVYSDTIAKSYDDVVKAIPQ